MKAVGVGVGVGKSMIKDFKSLLNQNHLKNPFLERIKMPLTFQFILLGLENF